MPMPEITHHITVKAELHYIKAATVSMNLTHEDATTLAIALLNATQEEGTISIATVYSKSRKYLSVFSRTEQEK